MLEDLYMSWAAVLEKDGHYANACKMVSENKLENNVEV